MNINVTSIALILTSSLMLSGCFYQTVNNYDLHRSIVFCKSPGNIASITAFVDGDEIVVCMDGTKSHLTAIKG